jgi:hypothetical protein
MLDRQLGHRKILGIASAQSCPLLVRGGGDQTVSLKKRDASSTEVASPAARLPCHDGVDRQHDEAAEQASRRLGLCVPESPDDLLDVDRGCGRDITAEAQGLDATDGGSTAEIIDQHRRIEDNQHD